MSIGWIDWGIIALYFVISLSIGLYMRRRASNSTGDFFLGGRKLPWYIAGTSMVATTFAADTPLAVTELVAQGGVAGNWLWWNMLFGGMLTVFFFARLWRRAGIMTDCEFVSIRYSGPQADFLRGFRALYIGVFMNVIVIAWVNLAMVKILKVMFPELLFFGMQGVDLLGLYLSSHLLWVGGLMLFVALYSSLSGMWGISLTDTFQFVIAMTGCIVLAIVVVNHSSIGGMAGLKEALPASYFSYLPSFSAETQTGGKMLQMSLVAMVAYLGVQWWASWYPGAEPGGGGYIAQRMMSAKNEKHSLFATLWFQIAHFAIRPWPWIIVALAALVLYPDATDKGATYVMVIRDFMPTGLMGLLLAAFLAAYMSTLASQTNWGTSYIINDLFKPYIKPGADEKYYVRISRITTVVLLILSLLVSTQFDRISDAWKFILACSGGIGLVLILRWYWWRINAWSEIAAMLAPYAVYPFLLAYGFSFESTLLIIVAWSPLVWVSVTFLTKPVAIEKLSSFYRKIHPGPGWKPVAVLNPDVVPDTGLRHWFVNWLVGCCMVLSFLFGAGYLLFGDYLKAIIAAIICVVSAIIIINNLKKGGIFGVQNS